MPHIIFNAILFQLLWFSAILTGWMWASLCLAVLLGHFFVCEKSLKVRLSCICFALVGASIDSVLIRYGIYQFPDGVLFISNLLPLWLSFMWLGFAACLWLSLAWLLRSTWLLLLFFAIGGPLSYMAGRALGALSFLDEDVWIISLQWLSLSVLLIVIRRFDGGIKLPANGSSPV